MRRTHIAIKTLISASAMFILSSCGTISERQSGIMPPDYQNSTKVGEEFHRLPAEKSRDKVPESTSEALGAYGQCVIDFNTLRAEKGLLSEAVRAHEAEDEERAEAYGEWRQDHYVVPKPEKPKRSLWPF